jgi:amino acid transporter
LPITLLTQHSGPLAGFTATVLLITGILAAMLSFHNSVARNVFALARERVLPAGLARIGTGAAVGAPVGGSLVQSALSAGVVTVAVGLEVDPLTGLFTWLAAIGAVAVLTVLVGTSIAALVFFHRADPGGERRESVMVRLVAPVVGSVAGIGILAVTVVNLSSLLGVSSESRKPWVVPGVVAAAAGLGLFRALVLRIRRPDAYRLIGRGRPHPLAVPEQRLADLEV